MPRLPARSGEASHTGAGTTAEADVERLPDHPLTSLSPTAQRILVAARSLVERKGIDGLRFEAISAQAQVNAASIRYHFGSKAGLIAALVDYLTHDQCEALLKETEALPSGPDRIHVAVQGFRRIVEDEVSFRTYFDLLPTILRDDRLRANVARLYEWYEQLDRHLLGMDALPDERGSAVASLTGALMDGLAIQRLLRGGDCDVEAAFAAFEAALLYLASERSDVATDGEPSD